MGPRHIYRCVLLTFALLGYFLVKFQKTFFASVLQAASIFHGEDLASSSFLSHTPLPQASSLAPQLLTGSRTAPCKRSDV